MNQTATGTPSARPASASPASSAGGAAPFGDDEQGGVDEVRVDVHVELGRLNLPISSLRTLAVGQVFETEQSLDHHTLTLWCGGQRVAQGQLVTVGDRVGLRIIRLCGEVVAAVDSTAGLPASSS